MKKTDNKTTKDAMLLTMKEVKNEVNNHHDFDEKAESDRKHKVLMTIEICAVALLIGIAAFFASKNRIDFRGRADTAALQTEVSLVPESINVNPSENTKINLVLTNTQNAIGYAMLSLKYNPSHLQLVQILPGDDSSMLFPLDNPNIETANQTGTITLIYGSENDQGQITQALRISTLEFKASGTSESEISIDSSKSQVVFVSQSLGILNTKKSVVSSKPITPTATATLSVEPESDRPIIMDGGPTEENNPTTTPDPRME